MNRTKWWMLLLCMLFGANFFGCSTATTCARKFENKEKLLEYLKSGFDKTNPRLFWDRLPHEDCSRMSLLLGYLGFDWFKWDRFEVSSDGNQIRFWGWDYPNQVLTIGKCKPPKFDAMPKFSFSKLDDLGNLVVWKNETDSRYVWTFAKGGQIWFDAWPSFDNAGKYFCSGGRYYNYEEDKVKELPLYIYSVSEPDKPLVKSSLIYCPDRIFTTKDKVYLIGNASNHLHSDIHCEVYRRMGDELVFECSLKILCPHKIGARRFSIEDFDTKKKQVLLSLEREKFFPALQYLYDIVTDKLILLNKHNIGFSYPYARFLDTDIFDKILETVEEK